jgi:metal-responsive CopG/Arc/MetJ family transcriptional regulator
MKTAISLPDELFEAVERIVRQSGRRRSAVYAEALREYVSRHSSDEITAAIDAALEELGESANEEIRFTNAAAIHVLRNTEW